MTNKSILGCLLLVVGISLLALLRWLTGGNKRDEGVTETNRFMLAHEQDNKGFVEKKLTEGMNHIPDEKPIPSGTDNLSSDSFFKETGFSENTPPSDKF
ncbi:hypothetical protein F4826_004790 [Rahnella inusitata]|nr:hypothetical protein [Rahnella inusitata]